jgi:phage terminase large subunit-like protein
MTLEKLFRSYSKTAIMGKFTKLAFERFFKDLEREDVFFNEAEAMRPIDFIQDYTCHWEGSLRGQQIILHPFQKFIIANLYGWYYPNAKRRFKSFYIQLARKNAKTTLVGLMALYDLLIDDDPTPQILVGANNEDQAKLTLHSAANIALCSPILKAEQDAGKLIMHKKYERYFSIHYRNEERNGMILAMSKTANTKDGTNPSKFIIDEYHEAKTDHLKNVSESGQASRENPSGGVITTAGFNRFGPCYQSDRRISVEILQGLKQDDTHFAVICEPDNEDKWKDPKEWLKANPLMYHEKYNNWEGANKMIFKFLEDRCLKAMNEGGTKEVDFKTKNLNIWTNAAKTWIPLEMWNESDSGYEFEDLKGQSAWMGLDLASVEDTASLVAVIPRENGQVDVICKVYIPESKIIERDQNGFNFQRWSQSGHLTATPGNVIDYDFIKQDVKDLATYLTVKNIAYDPYMSTQIVLQLQDEGLPMGQFSQGIMNMSPPTKELYKLVKQKFLNHNQNPVLAWMISNIDLYIDANENIKIHKGRSQDKVDGAVALVMALGAWMADGKEVTNKIIDAYDFVGG